MKRLMLHIIICVHLFPGVAFSATAITTRSEKGSALTWSEMDANFTALRDSVDNGYGVIAAQIAAVTAGQAGGTLGYVDKATMDADLAHDAGTLAKVTNDSTASNNGNYIKLGTSGAGSWQKSAYQDQPFIDAAIYGYDLNAAVVARGSTPTTLFYGADITVSANITIPATFELMPINGALIQHSTYTISYAGPVDRWPPKRIFSGTGAISGLSKSMVDWIGDNTNPGTTDITTAFQAAIYSLQLTAGKLILLPTQYAVSSSLTIGDGTISAASTRNNIEIAGAGIGGTVQTIAGNGTGSIIKWIGAAGGTVFDVRGPITGLSLHDLQIDCNNLASTGLNLMHPQFSAFKRLIIKGATAQSPNYDQYAIVLDNYKQTTAAYDRGAISNVFEQVIIRDPGTVSNGAILGSSSWITGDNYDVLQTTFTDCTFVANTNSNATTTAALTLQFTDNISFYNCIVGHSGTGYRQVDNASYHNVALLVKPPTGNTYFPTEVGFFNTAVIGGYEVSGTWAPPGGGSGLRFSPWHTGDGEGVPPTKYFFGDTSAGRKFGMGYSGCIIQNRGGSGQAITTNTATAVSLPYHDKWDFEGMYFSSGNANATYCTTGCDSIKPIATGYYHLTGQIEWQSSSAGTIRRLSIYKYDATEGTSYEIARSDLSPNAGGATSQIVSVDDESTSASNFYYLVATHNAGSNLNINNINAGGPNYAPKFSLVRFR